MPSIHAFRAVQYAAPRGDASALVAPPYDVLDPASKAALLAREPRNIVAVDLPHTPAKELGPPEAYARAADALRAWLGDGTLVRRPRPALFAYRQTFQTATRAGTPATVRRHGMACTLDLAPFGPRAGGGILPHEETFSGPKEDRLALMKATGAQLSPIFGLHADERGRATAVIQRVISRGAPDLSARLAGDGVLHEVWTVEDEPTIAAYRDALAGEDVFIADGHHRYTTQLNYVRHLESRGHVPPDHPARRCMFVLVGMSDPGLVIWPTHRVLGGMRAYSLDALLRHAAGLLDVRPVPGGLESLDRALAGESTPGQIRVGLFDFASGRAFIASPAGSDDPLAARFPGKPREWRTLDVAFVQHVIVEELCQPKLNAGEPVRWAFPHTIAEVAQIGSGTETGAGGGGSFGATGAQLAVIVRPTPLDAVRAVSRAGELMPQKSTFFYPKLATGLFLNVFE